MARALIVVPPFLKSVAGPLLGPAMLAGAARGSGHRVEVLDLNSAWLGERLDLRSFPPGTFVGDHDRPSGALRVEQAGFARLCRDALPPSTSPLGEDPALTVMFSHEAARAAARLLATDRALGGWIEGQVARHPEAPSVVGVSVLYSGQVLAALATTLVARKLWPGALIVWGGSHVTALRDALASDSGYAWAADRFVVGHAERTFVAILDAADGRRELPDAAMVAGRGAWVAASDDPAVVPCFDAPRTPWPRLTLPAQASRGCAYGRCAFCTYPAIEGRVRLADDGHLVGVVEAALRNGAAVSLKDSLVVPARLEHFARLVDGRLPWSACTKLAAGIDEPFARRLAAGGCATIEVGLETLTPDGQLLFDKRQTPELFRGVLGSVVGAGISVVINYMTGLPGADSAEEAHWLAWVQAEVEALGGQAKVEHNSFQLERLSPMGRAPDRYGLRVTQTWPWASVMAWERAVSGASPPNTPGSPR